MLVHDIKTGDNVNKRIPQYSLAIPERYIWHGSEVLVDLGP